MTLARLRSTIVTGVTSTWVTTGVLSATVVLTNAETAQDRLAAEKGGVEAAAHGGEFLAGQFFAGFQVFDDQCLHYSSPKVGKWVKKLGFMVELLLRSTTSTARGVPTADEALRADS